MASDAVNVACPLDTSGTLNVDGGTKIDFAAKVIDFPGGADLTALKRWYDIVVARPSAKA